MPAGNSERAALTEEQYLQVCDACDKVLLSSDSTLERMSIPWLHVIREHPSFLKNYEMLFATSSALRNAVETLETKVRSYAGWLRQMWRALTSDSEPWNVSQTLSGPVDALFVSHLLNDADAGKAADFYFGNLPDQLSAEGRRVVIALIDHSATPDASRAHRWDKSPSPRVVLSGTLGLQGELSLFRRLIKESSRLAKLSREASGILKNVLVRASLEAMSGNARATLRMSIQLNRLVATINPKMMIVTYEGHAWERVAFSVARDASTGLQCVGYQHAAIFKLQHSALRKLGRPFDPDLILTAGPVSKRQIENSTKAQGIRVLVLGSNRALSARKNYEIDLKRLNSLDNTCLVLPEGIISECLVLFDFSLRCAALMPSTKFIWRLHPLITFERLMDGNDQLRHLPANVEISRVSMEEDFKRSKFALYRGSTAIVSAVSAGLRPVYLLQFGEMSIDPLYELDAAREKVANPADLEATFSGSHTTEEELVRNQQIIARYCETFYSPVVPAVVLSLLS